MPSLNIFKETSNLLDINDDSNKNIFSLENESISKKKKI